MRLSKFFTTSIVTVFFCIFAQALYAQSNNTNELFQAIYDGDIERAKIAIARVSNIDETNEDGNTALFEAIETANVDMVAMLVFSGAKLFAMSPEMVMMKLLMVINSYMWEDAGPEILKYMEEASQKRFTLQIHEDKVLIKSNGSVLEIRKGDTHGEMFAVVIKGQEFSF